MPNLITHLVSSGEVLKRLPVNIKSEIESSVATRSAYMLGSIGPDFMFSLRELGKNPKRLPNRMHTFKQAETFEAIAKALHDSPDQVKTAYALGLVTHYALDSALHPYVYGMCESFVGDALDHVSYATAHQLIESALDEYVLEQEGYDPTNSYDARRALSSTKATRLSIGKLYRDVVAPLYGIGITPSEVSLGFELTGTALCVLRDKSGRRAGVFRKLETAFMGGKRKVTSLMHPPYGYGEIDYLNNEHKPFRTVRNLDVVANKTCAELLEEAKERAVNIFVPHLYEALKSGGGIDCELFTVSYEGVKNR